MENQGCCSLHVKLTDSRVVHCHLDQIRPMLESTDMNPDSPKCEADDPLMTTNESYLENKNLYHSRLLNRDTLLDREDLPII